MNAKSCQVFRFDADRIPSEPKVTWFYQDEWDQHRSICESFARSKLGQNDLRLNARSCSVEEIDVDESSKFLDQNHLQGRSRRSRVVFGLRHLGELVGLMSLADHHRQGHGNTIVLDRLAFKGDTTVRGGVSRLLSRGASWAKYNMIDILLTYSDNRLTDGTVYGVTGFVFDGFIRPDYFYVNDEGCRFSKQSQKKNAVHCPYGMTECEWALSRGLRRIHDLGKRRWVMKINPASLTKKEKQSLICAEQHSRGIFKKNKIRGEFVWRGEAIYFASSFELRYLFETQENKLVKSVQRGDFFRTTSEAGVVKGRNPDFLVTYTDGHQELVEIKPLCRVQESRDQIQDSRDYADRNGINFKVWTEKDSDLSEDRKVILWARRYLASLGQSQFLTESMQRNREKSLRFYHSNMKEQIDVYCDYCKLTHTVREIHYRKNVEKNNRFICAKENGRIQGSLSKGHLKNPLASEGNKKCSGACSLILPLDDFSVSNKATGARCGQCKKCRAAKATAAYRSKIKPPTKENS